MINWKNLVYKIKSIHIYWIEYEDDNHYLSVGKYAPWDNRIQIRLPKIICEKLNNIF